MPSGRLTKWKDEFCEMLVKHMTKGNSFVTFGAIIDVTEETLHKWKREKPTFSESYKKGRLRSQLYWENLGKGQVIGKFKGPSATWTFNMKNRFGWTDRREERLEIAAININIKGWDDI